MFQHLVQTLKCQNLLLVLSYLLKIKHKLYAHEWIHDYVFSHTIFCVSGDTQSLGYRLNNDSH